MWPRRYFAARYFASRYWLGRGLLERLVRPARLTMRAMVKGLVGTTSTPAPVPVTTYSSPTPDPRHRATVSATPTREYPALFVGLPAGTAPSVASESRSRVTVRKTSRGRVVPSVAAHPEPETTITVE